MRARLQAARPATVAWEAKDGPGRLMDIELLAQTAALRRRRSVARTSDAQLRAGVGSGFLTEAEVDRLGSALTLCRAVLHCGSPADRPRAGPADLGEGGRAFVLREAGAADVRRADRGGSQSLTDAAAAVIAAKLGDPAPEGGRDDADD